MSHYFLFAVASLVAVALPGPDFLLVFQTALRKGKRAGVMSAIGIALGLCVHGTAATIGLSALLVKSARAFEIVKWIGAGYLAYLAVQLLLDLARSRNQQDSAPNHLEEEVLKHVSAKKYVLRGFLTNVLNIKAALFFVAIVPQFVESGQAATPQLIIISIIQVSIALMWFCALALATNKLGVFLKRRVVQRWLDGATAAIFLALASKLATTSRHT